MSEEEKEAIKFIQGEIEDLLNDIEYYKEYQNIVEKEEVHLKQTILNLIDKQQKIIDLMAKHLNQLVIDDENASLLPFCEYDTSADKIKEYFYKKVEEENERRRHNKN